MMKRMKLYVVEEWSGDKWEPRYLQRGEFRWVLHKAQSLIGQCTRVRRVKTPAERDQYLHLNTIGNKAKTEWLN